METCKKLEARCIQLEKCLNERVAPTVICPPTAPICPQPFFRRPLFQRGELLFPRGEPVCEPLQQCEPITTVAPMPTATPTSNYERLPMAPKRANPTVIE